jgi:hypothetical protein
MYPVDTCDSEPEDSIEDAKHSLIKQLHARGMTTNGPRIGEHIPPAIRKIVSVRLRPKEQEQYNLYSAEPKRTLVFHHKKLNRHMWRADKYRILTLLGTWLGSQYVHGELMAKDTEKNVRKLDEDGSMGKWLVHRCLTKIAAM